MTQHLTGGHIPGENLNSKRYMHSNLHCNTLYHSQDIQHFLIIAKMEKKKKEKILKQTVSNHGIQLLGICKSKCLKIIKQSKNQVSKPNCMLAFK